MNPTDTIIAISSAPGSAPRGIIRLSGPEAIQLAKKFFHPEIAPGPMPPSWHLGTLTLENHKLPASLLAFRAPRSYTGQDTIELHTIGSAVLLGMIVEMFLAAGARRAEPGEFTARAFLAGKLDLSQVHAVAGLIAARSDMQLRAAERLLHGALSQRANEAREELADLLSLVEGAMDFADEPIEFITAQALRTRLSKLHDMLSTTIDAGHRAERWGGLPRVLLVGKPNAGKSSLLNALTGTSRAIASPIAGTTRDAISAPLNLGETECLLIDIAGLDEANTELDRKAQILAQQAIRDADLILEVSDASDGSVAQANSLFHTSVHGTPAPPEQSPVKPNEIPRIRVANKSDLVNAESIPYSSNASATHHAESPIPVSALTGHNLDNLRKQIAGALSHREIDRRDDAIALMADHRESLERAIDAIGRAIQMARDIDARLADADLVAAELRIAAEELATLVGKDQTEDMLGRIFARFCVGK